MLCVKCFLCSITSPLHKGWVLWASPYHTLCSPVVLRPCGDTRLVLCRLEHLADVVSWALPVLWASCLGLYHLGTDIAPSPL